MSKKGQIISIDLIASVLLFSILLAFVYQSWSANEKDWYRQRNTVERNERAVRIANQLIESPGYPAVWTTATVQAIGLASFPNVLDTQKIDLISAMNYDVIREKLNIANYGFFLQLSSPNSSLDQNIGLPPDENQSVSAVQRSILIGEDNATIIVQLFE